MPLSATQILRCICVALLQRKSCFSLQSLCNNNTFGACHFREGFLQPNTLFLRKIKKGWSLAANSAINQPLIEYLLTFTRQPSATQILRCVCVALLQRKSCFLLQSLCNKKSTFLFAISSLPHQNKLGISPSFVTSTLAKLSTSVSSPAKCLLFKYCTWLSLEAMRFRT